MRSLRKCGVNLYRRTPGYSKSERNQFEVNVSHSPAAVNPYNVSRARTMPPVYNECWPDVSERATTTATPPTKEFPRRMATTCCGESDPIAPRKRLVLPIFRPNLSYPVDFMYPRIRANAYSNSGYCPATWSEQKLVKSINSSGM